MKIKWAASIVREAVKDFMEDKALRLSAALAYYAIFSLAPLLIIVIAVVSLFLGEESVRGQVHQYLEEFMGSQSASTVESMMSAQGKAKSIGATIVGIVVLIFGATGVFGQLQESLNTIWGVQPKPGGGIRALIKERFLSLSVVLGTGFLLLISMVVSAVLSAITAYFGHMLPIPGFVVMLANFLVTFIVIALLFAMIFKVLPDANVQWRDVWTGAIFTAFLFSLGKFGLGLYLGRAGTASAYGAAGSFVVVLLWVYYSSVILFFGAEFTKVYAKQRGSRIVPSKGAMAVTEEARAQQGIPHEEHVAKIASTALAEQNPAFPSTGGSSALEHRGTSPQISAASVAAPQLPLVPKPSEIIHDKPWPYLGIALGLGFSTGWVFKQRISDRHQSTLRKNGSGFARKP